MGYTKRQRDYLLLLFVRRLISLLCSYAHLPDPVLPQECAGVQTPEDCAAVLKKVARASRHATEQAATRIRNAVVALEYGNTPACAAAIASGQTEAINYLVHAIEADIELAARCLTEDGTFDRGKLYPKGYEALALSWPPLA
jgi:hypothetical protein